MTSEILDKLKWRYACKKFDASKKLSEEKLTVLKQAFNLTATSYGLQPLKMLVISNQTLKEELVPLTMNQQAGSRLFRGVGIVYRDPNLFKLYQRIF